MTGLSGRSKFGAVFVPIILLFLISGLNITTAYAQGTDVCESPDDKPWTGCLTEIAKYTAWMVVPSTDVSPGDLQSAIDGIYGDLQQEWTGPLRSRTHVRWLFLMVPGGLLAYLIIIFVVSRLFPPRFPPGGDPIWTAEKLMIVLAGLIICCVWIAERMYSYEEMNAQYRIVSDAITPFIHLRAPAQLANATSNPCEAIYKDSDLLLGLCRQEWASGARLALGRLLKSRFAKESLLQSLIAIGRRCQNVQIPKWWDSGYADEGERVMKLDCPVFHAGSSSVKARELAGIADLRAWVLGKTPGAVLKLEDAFHVQTAGGGRAVYQEKVTNLIGGAKFEEYRSDFRSTSWRWVASGVVLLAGLGLLLYYSRREELVGGSAKWGGIRHLGLRILICVGFIALGISHWLVSVG